MLTRPPHDRPVLPGPNTWLYDAHSYDGYVEPSTPYPDMDTLDGTSPTLPGHQPAWAVMHNPTTEGVAYLWICLTEVNQRWYGEGECGAWKMAFDRESAEIEAARHAAYHDQAALAAYLNEACQPPTTVFSPSRAQVETAIQRAQRHGPCSVQAITDAILRMRAATGFTTVDRQQLQWRLNQLALHGRITLRQQQEWRALTGVSWPSRTRHDILYATRQQAEQWQAAARIQRASARLEAA
ncbi:hypothetical protein [Streptomyces europaeiscabiei]|uniref:hypothetical protein n=1 Tax=Streptomyces europaeiscabiei TaxID=146819 RepID=UPI0038F6C205